MLPPKLKGNPHQGTQAPTGRCLAYRSCFPAALGVHHCPVSLLHSEAEWSLKDRWGRGVTPPRPFGGHRTSLYR